MEIKKIKVPYRRILVTLAVYLAVILASLILAVTQQIAGWVAQVAIAFALLRLAVLAGWGTAKNGWGWRA